MNRIGGADVCENCVRGLAPYVIREQRGWDFKIKQWSRMKDDGESVYYTDAELRFAEATAVQFKAWRKSLLRSLVCLVRPGVVGGDKLFDNHVYVHSATHGTTKRVIEDDGVQSILLDMLGAGSWVEVTGGQLRSYSVRDHYVEEARFSSEMCVLADHVLRLGG